MSDDPVIAATWLTLKLASCSTLLLLLLGAPLAWWLSRSRLRIKPLVEALIALPLVLPPTVIGFYLLLAFAPQTGLGQMWYAVTGSQLSFSFSALVIGSVLYSLPFVVQPLQAAFNAIPDGLLEAGSTMGANRWDRITNIVLPLSRRGLLAATSLGFAHTVGEFGIVLMIGGNIPGETRVLSIALYDHVEALEYDQAHILAAGLLFFSFALLLFVYMTNHRLHLKSGAKQ